MNKILITGDILKPDPKKISSNQRDNIIWFYNLIYPFIRYNTESVDVEIILSEQFNPQKFYSFFKKDVSVENWAALYDCESLPENANDYLKTYFSEYLLIVGYELPTIFIKYFEANDIKFINCFLSPIRFLNDLLFSAYSNINNFDNIFNIYKVTNEEIFLYSGLHTATIKRQNKHQTIVSNSCLIIGQTEIDRSVIRNGEFDSLKNHISEITELCLKYNKVYFKPHPYSKKGNELTYDFKKLDIEIINDNVYHLLANDNIIEVVALSSSVLYEAKYFYKKIKYLIPENDKFDLPISNDFFSYSFWHNVLSNCVPTVNEIPKGRITHRENLLRNSLNMYWGYNELSPKILFDNLANQVELKIEKKYKISYSYKIGNALLSPIVLLIKFMKKFYKIFTQH